MKIIQNSKEREKNLKKINEQQLLFELEERQEQKEKAIIQKRNLEKLKNNKDIKSVDNIGNEKYIDNSIDIDETEITQFNVSVNVDVEEIEEDIKKDEKKII